MKINFTKNINFSSADLSNKTFENKYHSTKPDIKSNRAIEGYLDIKADYNKSLVKQGRFQKGKKNNKLYSDKETEKAKRTISATIQKTEKLKYNKIVNECIEKILNSITHIRQGFIAYYILQNEAYYNNPDFMANIERIISTTSTDKSLAIKSYFLSKYSENTKLTEDKDFMEAFGQILSTEFDNYNGLIADRILSNERLYKDKTLISRFSEIDIPDEESCKKALRLVKDGNILPSQIWVCYEGKADFKDIKKLNQKLGKDAEELDETDTILLSKFIDLYGITSVEEIPLYTKRKFLKHLLKENGNFFFASDIIKKSVPLFPKGQRAYCELLPKLIESMKIRPPRVIKRNIEDLNLSLMDLETIISKITKEDLDHLKIKQSYSKDDFIKELNEILNDYNDNEKNRILNYFGFKIYFDKNSKTYNISGYPMKLDKKPDNFPIGIIKPIENAIKKFDTSKIICSNEDLEMVLERLLNVLSELRIKIGKNNELNQDSFLNSLKIIKEMTENPQYCSLSAKNKKILVLSALMQDIAQYEDDKDMAENSALDSYFILDKIGLKEIEQDKIYTLIKNSKWFKKLGKANSFKDFIPLAYDLRFANELKLSKILEESISKVQKDNLKNFGVFSMALDDLVQQIKSTQPMLPTTKFPSASRINKAITKVNPDGSTDIKGVYKDEDGLIIIKFNEVEDWEKIGFSKGTISRGINFKTPSGEDIDTGNIKFFVHGLSFDNELVNFDAFSLINSDAVISASYAQFPESSYHFFRPQGLILDCKTKNIHAGGTSAVLSGYKKTIKSIEENYIFEGKRNYNRSYISNLIKTHFRIQDKDYEKFIKAYSDKEMSDFNHSLQNVWTDIFKKLTGSKRNDNREYNEVLISNPSPMAVYVCIPNKDKNDKNPVELLNEEKGKIAKKFNVVYDCDSSYTYDRTMFLRRYALNHAIPLVVLGE